jgi:hypothetical protein
MLLFNKLDKQKIMKTTQKSPEILQAQVAVYVAETVQSRHDEEYIYANIGAIAAGGMHDITRVTTEIERKRGENVEIIKTPAGTMHTVITPHDYADYLKSVGGSKYEGIQGRAKLQKKYSEEFAPTINHLLEELSSSTLKPENIKILGDGLHSTTVAVNHEGKEYAVRIPSDGAFSPKGIDQHLGAATLVKDGDLHLEKVIAASYETGVTIAEIVPGKQLGEVTMRDMKNITDNQLSDLVDTLGTIHNRGIQIDPKPSNFLYEREVGFGFVDLSSKRMTGNHDTLGKIVGIMAENLQGLGEYNKNLRLREMTIEAYADDLRAYEAKLDTLLRYRDIVAAKIEGQDKIEALRVTDNAIASAQEVVSTYSDPGWVKNKIEPDTQQAQRLAKNYRVKDDDFVG